MSASFAKLPVPAIARHGWYFVMIQQGRAAGSPPTDADDGALLNQLQSGEQRAMQSVYDRYSAVVYSVALRVLREPTAAEDVVYQVFMQIWRDPESFRASSACLGGALAVLARNLSVEVLRRRRPEPPLEVPISGPANLADHAMQNRIMERARSALKELPRAERKALEMAFFDGLTDIEIADITGDAPGTVRTRLRTSLLSIRKAFTS